MNPFERVHNNIFNFEEEMGQRPDVIFITQDFLDLLMLSGPNPYFSFVDNKLFGLNSYIVSNPCLDGLDFKCFRSEHLNALGDRYKKDNRYSDYNLEINVPRMKSWESSYISNGSSAPTINDRSTFKKIVVNATNEVLRRWVYF